MKFDDDDTLLDKIKNYYWQLWPYNWRPGQVWYRLKCFVWHRYTTVKPRYLPHTWMDRCEIMPHVMFEVLCQFLEKECNPGNKEWYGEHGRKLDSGKYVMDEMKDIAEWWTGVWNKAYPEVCDQLWKEANKHPPVSEFEPCDDNPHLVSWDLKFANDNDDEIYHRCLSALNKGERAMEEQRIEMMHRLVTITPHLWD